MRPQEIDPNFPDKIIWERPATREGLLEALEILRPLYLQWLANMKPLGMDKVGMRAGGTRHSLLYRLSTCEKAERNICNPLERLLTELDKVKLLFQVAEEIGHRPKTVAIKRVSDCDWVNEIQSLLQESEVIFLKKDKGANGNGVALLERLHTGIRVTLPSGVSFDVETPEDERFQRLIAPHTRYLIESKIPIALTPKGESWEIRFVPPFPEVNYAKVGLPNTFTNNLARGGQARSTREVIRGVLLSKMPQLSYEFLERKIDLFLSKAFSISEESLALVQSIERDFGQVLLPRKSDCFEGTFLVMDVTGVWDPQTGNLDPVIIECQPGGSLSGLGETGSRRLILQITQAINTKLRCAQADL